MLQALLKSLGFYENSARLRKDLQFLVDEQRAGLQRKTVAVASLLAWCIVAALCASIAIIIAMIAVYISLRESFGPQTAIWTVLAVTTLLALVASFVAWRSAVTIPELPPITVPELYRPPDVVESKADEAPRDSYSKAESFGVSAFTATPSLDNSLKDWMIKTARQSATSIHPDAVPVDTLLKTVAPHVSAAAGSALDDVAEQLEKGSKGKIALILGSAVMIGLLMSRTVK